MERSNDFMLLSSEELSNPPNETPQHSNVNSTAYEKPKTYTEVDYKKKAPRKRASKIQKSNAKVVSRKKHRPDGIRKKIKVHFLHNYIKGFLNEKLQFHYPGKNYMFNKLDKKTVSKIDIKFNCLFLQCTVKDVFSRKNACEKEKVKDEWINKTQMKRLEDKIAYDEELKYFLNSSLAFIYGEKYRSSTLFEDYSLKIRNKYEDPYSEDYNELAKDFISYYLTTKANSERKAKNERETKTH
jgi:hypothetical protein